MRTWANGDTWCRERRLAVILALLAVVAPTNAMGETPTVNGIVHLHIETAAPTLELHVFDGWSAPRGYARRRTEAPIGRLVCVAPCDTWIDARVGYQYFLDGPSLRPSSFFRLQDRSGPVVASVEAGERSTYDNGVLVSALGGFGLGVGGLLFVGGLVATGSDNADWHKDARALTAAGGVTLGVGAAVLITGIVLLVKGTTRYSLTADASSKPPVETFGARGE